MTLYFQIRDTCAANHKDGETQRAPTCLAVVTSEKPAMPETPPSPWLKLADVSEIKALDLDTMDGREALAKIVRDVPLYRITMELLIDRILLESLGDAVRMKAVRTAFSPEDPPEPVADIMTQKYAFSGVLHFPIIASRNDGQLIDLYLRLYGPATPMHANAGEHLAALLGGLPERLIEKCDGILWRGAGLIRLDRLVYEAERMDNDPEVTFESYVTRGRAAAEALAVDEPVPLLAAWIQAERVQRELCRDIDSILRLMDVRRLPRWIRADVFRILEREAMKQVFAEGIAKRMGDWPALRRSTILAEPIAANAKGEVAPLIQQLLNQTLSADASYAGSAEAFALQAERRWSEAKDLLGN